MQWKYVPVPRAADGKACIHYTTIYRVFANWSDDGSLEQAFIASVRHLAGHGHLDLSVLHGDGTNTVAKKGGDGIGYSGHEHQKGEKILAIIDNNGFVLVPARRCGLLASSRRIDSSEAGNWPEGRIFDAPCQSPPAR